MTNQSFIDRLLAIIDDLTDGNKLKFAKMLGISPSYIDRWTNQGILPSAEHLANIQDKLNINLNWLVNGKGERYAKREIAGEVREILTPYGPFSDINEDEKDYLKKLLRIMRTKQDKTVVAIKQNIDAFLDNPNKQVKKNIVNE